MPAQTHAAIQGDSPTPLHAHQHAPTRSLQHLTGEVLATAHLLQQQVRTLECLAHATEERGATLAQQRAKLQELLRLVTQMETAEVRATASLRDTLARVRVGRDRSAATSLSFAALLLAASPGGSPRSGSGEGSSVAPPFPLGGDGTGSGGGGGGEGDTDPADDPDPEGVDPKGDAEECEAGGGKERIGQPGEDKGTDGASKPVEAGSGGDNEDASQPLPQFALLRVQSEEGERKYVQEDSKEGNDAPQEDGDVSIPLPLAEAGATASPGASANVDVSRPMDQDRCGEKGRAGADTEHDAGRVDALGLKEAQRAEDGEGELASDPRPASVLGGATKRQAEAAPAPSKQGNEPTEMRRAAAGSEGSWRVRRRMPERNAKEQPGMKGVSAAMESRQGGAKGKGGQGDIDGQADGQKKRGGQRTPSPKKAQVPGDRVQPSPPKKAGKAKGGAGRRN